MTADAMMPRSSAGQAAATWRTDWLLAGIVVLLALCAHAAAGFPTLAASHGDNDSLLRLVQVRDLIAGQGWYDLHQYRMGPQGGFVMHWSRIVDAPIAAIILAVSAVTGSVAAGETVALIAWPSLLMLAALGLLLRLARSLGGDWAVLPALSIGGAALYFIGVFAPGAIDHHNVQLVLSLAALAGLACGRGAFAGVASGAASALMLAVGMETLPYVAVAGLATSAGFLFGGREQARKACGFGAGLAGLGAVAFVATVPPSAWLVAQCDSYSIPQFSIALMAGAGLAAASSLSFVQSTFARRLAALVLLGAAVALVAALCFPQCLGDPYAGLDPRLQQFWLNAITEAQPLWKVVGTSWAMAVSYYVTPLIGLAVLAWRMRTAGISWASLTIGAFLATAVAVSVWQVRGATFAIPFAAIPLAAWVGEQRRRVRSAPDGRNASSNLKMAFAWLVSLNVAWSGSANALARSFGAPPSPGAVSVAGTCDRAADYAALAAQPATTVLAISNLGSPILADTHHRVLAGPYHRNVTGNLAALDAFMGTTDRALAVMRGHAVGLVAVCRGNDETRVLARWAPGGFLAAIVDGRTPAWLERLPQAADARLEVYRVRPTP